MSTFGDVADQLVAATADWSGCRLLVEHDRASGAWIVLAIHSIRNGRFDGGTRITSYDSVSAAAGDAMHLAEAMSHKWAVHQIPCGGAKAVITRPGRELTGENRWSALRRYAALIRDWRGAFTTGGDMGSSSDDLNIVAEEADGDWVYGSTRYPLGAGDSSVLTAAGLESAIRSTAAALDERTDLRGMRVAVQGTGKVGRNLIDRLVTAGAHVTAADPRPSALAGLSAGGVEVVAADQILFTECDILAPCAFGGVLNPGTIPRLRCQAIVGGANNQLSTEQDATRLAARGILYGPDFVVNAGGAIADIGMAELGWSRQQAHERASGIGDTLTQVYARATRAGITPYEAALQHARSYDSPPRTSVRP